MATLICDKVCKVCGKTMHNVYATKVYCDNCYQQRKNEKKRIARAKQKELDQYKKKQEYLQEQSKQLSVGEIAKMASDEHLTYGQFVTKYGI